MMKFDKVFLGEKVPVYLNERMIESVEVMDPAQNGIERCLVRMSSGKDFVVAGDADYVYRKLRVEMRRGDGQGS